MRHVLDGDQLRAVLRKLGDLMRQFGQEEYPHDPRRALAALQAIDEGKFDIATTSVGLACRYFETAAAVEALITAGYHKATNGGEGMPASAYRKLWPGTVIQPPEYAGRFDEELLVDTTIKDSALVKHGNIYTLVDPASCSNLALAPTASRYIAFIQLGKKNLNRSVEDCRSTFAADEVGLTALEGLHLPVQHAAYLRQYAVDLAGSRYGSVNAPYVSWFGSARPNFCAVGARFSHPLYGSASRGSAIISVP